jgi:chlorobactene glucosyltransferase
MTLLLASLLIFSGLLELTLFGAFGWRERRLVALLSVITFSAATGGLLAWKPGLGTVLLFFVSCYRLFNLLRAVKSRTEEAYLWRGTRRTSSRLILIQCLILGLSMAAWQEVFVTTGQWLWGMAIFQLVVAVWLFLQTRRNLRKTLLLGTGKRLGDRDLPSITVAIPARNEDEQLEQCLQSIVASDYPKLEVIVLDDCSHDRTPDIIREYAHAGVRFISGDSPENSWLPKNNAYAQLAKNASGELILFCGVDVRFDAGSLRKLVAAQLRKHKTMTSVLPLNTEVQRPPYVQSMRYYWELVPPRRLFNRPAVLSSCWMISRKSLDKAGGFAAISRSISPESYFAREALKSDGYSFVRSGISLGITSVKNADEQIETSIRTRYPQLHRRPELVLLASVVELFLLIGPLVIAIAGVWTGTGLSLQVIALAAFLVQVAVYGILEVKLFSRRQLLPLLAFPLAVLGDVAFLHASMYRYEFSEVLWKGRNVCLPVMRVIPHLPRLK